MHLDKGWQEIQRHGRMVEGMCLFSGVPLMWSVLAVLVLMFYLMVALW
jgi:hypothetical protein